MNDLLRPAGGAFHGIDVISPRAGASIVAISSDPSARPRMRRVARELPPVVVGDVLAIRDTGAYGAVMASNYNRRPLAAEVLVVDGRCRVIRRRHPIDEMLILDL
jgi:diaminopimelate decarboxylase